MIWLGDAFDSIRGFFEAGGMVLWGVFMVTLIMWTLIVERVWFFRLILPARIEEVKSAWDKRADTTSWYAKRIRERMISEISAETTENIGMIKTCIAVAPLFGLLGTVTGMIAVFDVMAALGTGNARAMASGVSAATLPTMAGMVVALSGIYFGQSLERRAKDAVEELSDELVHH